jgi:cytochrome c-type biogenesis protein CcmF
MLSREAIFLFNNLVFVGLAFVVFFGTFFPLISEAFGSRRNVGPPWFDRVTVPLALALVGLAGIAPLIAWRRVTVANLRRNFTVPVAVGLAATVMLAAVGDVASKPYALAMFGLAAFLVAGVAQEFWRGARARRAMSADSWPLSFVSLVRRNRRRYGGYLVHVGMATLFVGVAASSAFQHARDVRLRPGQTASVGGYDYRYVKPTGVVETRDGRLERITLGAQLEVSKGGKLVRTLTPSRGYYPSSAPFAPVSGMFDGESTSEVRMVAGLRRDVWTAVQPELTSIRPRMRLYDRALRRAAASGRLSSEAEALAFGKLLQDVVDRYSAGRPFATFRLIVSPMVAWIWIGGIIVFCGGLVAIWPAPDAARRRATAGYAARVAQELGRA